MFVSRCGAAVSRVRAMCVPKEDVECPRSQKREIRSRLAPQPAPTGFSPCPTKAGVGENLGENLFAATGRG